MNVFSRLENVQESLSEADFKEIRNLLESGSFEMRAQIIDLLSKRKVSHETRLLGELLKKEKDAKIRLLAAIAIAEQPHFFVEDFEYALDDPDAAIRNLAREAVKKKTAKALMASTNFLAIKSPADWYNVEEENLLENVFSEAELALFEGSVSKMIMELVPAPEGGWKPWLFYEGVPDSFWDIPENQKAYMKWLVEKLGFRKPEDWYELTGKMIRANSGDGLLTTKFDGSVSGMVGALVEAPEGGWLPWLLRGVPSSFWDDEANQKAYMEWLGEKLGYTKPEDWYLLTQDLIQENSGNGLLQQKFIGSPSEMVKALVEAPEGGWKLENFFADLGKMEGRMRDILSRWLNELEKPSFDERKTHGLKFKESGRGIGVGILFQELSFALEYQGHQHFQAIESFGGQGFLERAQKRDQEKREAFKNAGYIYIEIPHFKWTGGSEAALKNVILEQLQEYEASSDAEVKARTARIRGVLQIVSDGDCETEKR